MKSIYTSINTSINLGLLQKKINRFNELSNLSSLCQPLSPHYFSIVMIHYRSNAAVSVLAWNDIFKKISEWNEKPESLDIEIEMENLSSIINSKKVTLNSLFKLVLETFQSNNLKKRYSLKSIYECHTSDNWMKINNYAALIGNFLSHICDFTFKILNSNTFQTILKNQAVCILHDELNSIVLEYLKDKQAWSLYNPKKDVVSTDIVFNIGELGKKIEEVLGSSFIIELASSSLETSVNELFKEIDEQWRQLFSDGMEVQVVLHGGLQDVLIYHDGGNELLFSQICSHFGEDVKPSFPKKFAEIYKIMMMDNSDILRNLVCGNFEESNLESFEELAAILNFSTRYSCLDIWENIILNKEIFEKYNENILKSDRVLFHSLYKFFYQWMDLGIYIHRVDPNGYSKIFSHLIHYLFQQNISITWEHLTKTNSGIYLFNDFLNRAKRTPALRKVLIQYLADQCDAIEEEGIDKYLISRELFLMLNNIRCENVYELKEKIPELFERNQMGINKMLSSLRQEKNAYKISLFMHILNLSVKTGIYTLWDNIVFNCHCTVTENNFNIILELTNSNTLLWRSLYLYLKVLIEKKDTNRLDQFARLYPHIFGNTMPYFEIDAMKSMLPLYSENKLKPMLVLICGNCDKSVLLKIAEWMKKDQEFKTIVENCWDSSRGCNFLIDLSRRSIDHACLDLIFSFFPIDTLKKVLKLLEPVYGESSGCQVNRAVYKKACCFISTTKKTQQFSIYKTPVNDNKPGKPDKDVDDDTSDQKKLISNRNSH